MQLHESAMNNVLEKLDLEHKQVRMKLPEGLLEVNAPVKKERSR